MGDTTSISWTDSTWNPWRGCKRVSPGCDHCYMFRGQEAYGKDPSTVVKAAPGTFYAPAHWREGRKVFVCSWSDFFIQQADEWRSEAWRTMLDAPQHTYQVLTKRPGRMAHWALTHPWPSNVWAGVSVESAKYLPRLDVLARVPAKVRFVSAEPLLGPVDLRPHLYRCACVETPCICKGLTVNWVIVGGESGPGHHPMEIAWVEAIAEQCQAAGVPLFIKQDSGPRPGQQGRIPDELWALKEYPG